MGLFLLIYSRNTPMYMLTSLMLIKTNTNLIYFTLRLSKDRLFIKAFFVLMYIPTRMSRQVTMQMFRIFDPHFLL